MAAPFGFAALAVGTIPHGANVVRVGVRAAQDAGTSSVPFPATGGVKSGLVWMRTNASSSGVRTPTRSGRTRTDRSGAAQLGHGQLHGARFRLQLLRFVAVAPPRAEPITAAVMIPPQECGRFRFDADLRHVAGEVPHKPAHGRVS